MNTKFTISELDLFVKQVKNCVQTNRAIVIAEYANYLNKCNDGKTLSIEAYSLAVLGVNDPYFDFKNDLTKYLYNFINSYRSFLNHNNKTLPNFDIDFYCNKFIVEAKKLGVKKFLNSLCYN